MSTIRRVTLEGSGDSARPSMGAHPHTRGIRYGLRLDEAAPDRIARQLHAVAHTELREDVLAVAVHRTPADAELERDPVARPRLGDQLQDLELARGERVARRFSLRPGPVEVVTNQSGYR